MLWIVLYSIRKLYCTPSQKTSILLALENELFLYASSNHRMAAQDDDDDDWLEDLWLRYIVYAFCFVLSFGHGTCSVIRLLREYYPKENAGSTFPPKF